MQMYIFSIKAANAVESVAYAVVHTKFIGGKSSGSDECVLYKILLVSSIIAVYGLCKN